MASMLGEVDLLGLDAFGNNPGMDTLYGTAIGAGVTSLVKHVKPSGAWPFLAGAGATAALYLAGPKTRHASLGAALGTAISSGLLDGVLSRVLGMFGMGSSAATAGVGLPQLVDIGPASPLRGSLGLPEVQYTPPVYGTNLGLPGINQVPAAYGVWNAQMPSGVAGPQLGQAPPVDLLGQPTSQSQQLELMGGPTISGLSAHYGATLLGSFQ